jgi:chaperonin GroEL (HSP60 family)
MELRSAHRAGEMAGIDQFTQRIINPYEYKIFDAAHVKIQCFKSATDAAASLIRIDFGYFRERVKEQRKDVIPEPVKQVRAATESYVKSLKYKK